MSTRGKDSFRWGGWRQGGVRGSGGGCGTFAVRLRWGWLLVMETGESLRFVGSTNARRARGGPLSCARHQRSLRSYKSPYASQPQKLCACPPEPPPQSLSFLREKGCPCFCFLLHARFLGGAGSEWAHWRNLLGNHEHAVAGAALEIPEVVIRAQHRTEGVNKTPD